MNDSLWIMPSTHLLSYNDWSVQNTCYFVVDVNCVLQELVLKPKLRELRTECLEE